MIFVDTNVVMYAIGRDHPLQAPVRQRLGSLPAERLATSAEVLQELLHAYLPVGRLADLDDATRLVTERMVVWPVTAEIVLGARRLLVRHPALTARDLVHLATCAVHEVDELWTYDRGLAAAFGP